jgi:hypothetical protein
MTDDRYQIEEVLHEFAAEPVRDAGTLERYLRAHPSMAEALVDLSLELRLRDATAATSVPEDDAWLDASWNAFQSTMAIRAAVTPIVDPFAALSTTRARDVRTRLGVPSGVMHGFRNRIVELASVPERFLRSLASELGSSLEDLRSFLSGPPRLAESMSFKADDAPEAPAAKVSFEQLLIDTRVPEEERSRLMADAD